MSSNGPAESTMNLTFKVYNKTRKLAGITLQLETTPESTVRDIKNQILDRTGVPLDAQWIIFGITHLEDDKKLYEYGIEDGYTLYCTPTTVEVSDMPNL